MSAAAAHAPLAEKQPSAPAGGPRPLALLDQGISLLADAGFQPALWFYAGALPWCCGMLWIWTRLATWHADLNAYFLAALLLAGLYAWKSYCTGRFMESLLPASPEPAAATALRGLNHAAAGAFFLCAWLASLATLLGVTAVYGASLYFPLELRARQGQKGWRRRALRGSFQIGGSGFGQQQFLALHCLLLAAILMVNLGIAVFLAPYLLNHLFGLETAWTRVSPLALMANSTFWAGLALLTYLLLAPFAQAAFAVRYFHRKSRRTGEDLELELRKLAGALRKGGGARA